MHMTSVLTYVDREQYRCRHCSTNDRSGAQHRGVQASVDHQCILAQLCVCFPFFNTSVNVEFTCSTQGCLLLFLGRIADLYSRKYTFIGGCAVLGILGMGCGFAQGIYRSLGTDPTQTHLSLPQMRSHLTCCEVYRGSALLHVYRLP